MRKTLAKNDPVLWAQIKPAKRIAAKLIAMDDEDKLRKIASYVNDYLNERAATTKHNERKA